MLLIVHCFLSGSQTPSPSALTTAMATESAWQVPVTASQDSLGPTAPEVIIQLGFSQLVAFLALSLFATSDTSQQKKKEMKCINEDQPHCF